MAVLRRQLQIVVIIIIIIIYNTVIYNGSSNMILFAFWFINIIHKNIKLTYIFISLYTVRICLLIEDEFNT